MDYVSSVYVSFMGPLCICKVLGVLASDLVLSSTKILIVPHLSGRLPSFAVHKFRIVILLLGFVSVLVQLVFFNKIPSNFPGNYPILICLPCLGSSSTNGIHSPYIFVTHHIRSTS